MSRRLAAAMLLVLGSLGCSHVRYESPEGAKLEWRTLWKNVAIEYNPSTGVIKVSGGVEPIDINALASALAEGAVKGAKP